MVRRAARGAGLVLGGLALGVVLALVGVFVYFRSVADVQLAERLLRGIDLPRGSVRLEGFDGDSVARVAMRDVVVRGRAGDTLVAAPLVRFRIDLTTMDGPGPMELSQVELREPYVNVQQGPDGELNLSQAAVVVVAGQELEMEEGANGALLRDVRIVGGRVRLATPWVPDSMPAAQRARVRLARAGGTLLRVRGVRDLDARLPLVRFGGDDGWRLEVAALRGRLTDPDVRLVALQGMAESRSGRTRFRLDDVRTDRSGMSGEGTVRTVGAQLQYQVALRVRNADFRDLQWFAPTLPSEGSAQGTVALASRAGGRVEVGVRDLVVASDGSRVTGRLSALVGGDAPASFWDTRLALEPVRLETLRALGMGADMPYTGEIRGTVASISTAAASAPELALNLAATFAPIDGTVPVSTVFLEGPVVVGAKDAPIRFRGARLSAQPLHLAALRPLAPDQAERLRGTVSGSMLLTGAGGDLAAAEGDLTYRVGDAPASRLTGASLQLTLGEETRFDLRARAEPLALATLAELFPSLPFREARLTGPVRVWGTSREVQLDAELAGSPGRFAVRGNVLPGTPLRFDVSGRVSAFSPEAVLTRPVPVEGPVTGTFAARGSATDFGFDVDLSQQDGRFALQGRFRQPGGTPQFEVAGDVTNFNIGVLIGRPQLFGSRMTGRVELSGGGRQPYRFSAGLRGPTGAMDVVGAYNAGAVPSYSLSGSIAGLNVQALPRGEALPRTSLNGTVRLQGQGTELESLAGSLQLSATGSSIGGVAVDNLEARLAVRGGVLSVDTLSAALGGTQLTAAGTLGLTRPVSTPLQFRAVTRDLARLTPLLPKRDVVEPRVGGSLLLQGSIAGSVRAPVVNATFRGQNLRYENWRAGRLHFDTRLAFDQGVEGVRGTLTLSGDRLQLAGRTTLDSLRLNLQGTRERVAVRAAASRAQGSDLLLAGVMELEGKVPRGVLLDSLMVRAGESSWQLANPASVRWGGVEGVRVANLNLRRLGDESGLIQVDGTLPPTGNAALRVAVRNLDLDVVRRVAPNAPEMAGVINMDALLQGPVSDPQLSIQLQGARVIYRGVVADSLALSARYDERRLVSQGSLWQGGLRLATLDAAVPMRLSLENTLPRFEVLRTEPLTARLVADSLPLALLGASNPQLEEVQGRLLAQVAVSGSVERPALSGSATIVDGAVTLRNLGIRYTRIQGRVTLENQLARLDSLSIWSDGRALINGTIRFADLDRPELFLTARFNSFHAVQSRDMADLTVSGNVALSGRYPEPVLTGDLALQNGTIYIPNLNNRTTLDLTQLDVGQIGADTLTAQALAPGLIGSLHIDDLNVTVEEGVWLQSEDARVEITTGREPLRIFRTGPLPRIYGTLQAVRGTYALTIGPLLREFEVVSGSVRFFGTPDFNPELDITAQHEVLVGGRTSRTSPLAVVVHVTGTLEYPQVTLTSNTRPPLPESELLNYLVFGRPTFQSVLAGGGINPAEQFLVQELLGGLLVRELGQLGLPCAYLTLRGRPQLTSGVAGLASNPFSAFGATTVECGVQLLHDVFLTLETGVVPFAGTPQFGASLDWQINNNLTARLAREPVQSGFSSLLFRGPADVEYQWSTDLRGSWEFGRPRTQTAPGSPAEDPVPPAPEAPPPATPPAPAAGQGAQPKKPGASR